MFSIKEVLAEGWKETTENIGFYFQVLIIYFSIIIGGTIILRNGGFIGQIILILIEYWLSLGILIISLKRARGIEAKVKDLFSGSQYMLNYFIASLLYSLIVVAGLFLFIIPGIVWGIKYMMYPFFIIDKNSGITESLKQSAVITKGEKFHLFKFSIIVSLISFIGIIALFIGIFWAYPTTLIASALVYLKLNNSKFNQEGIING